MVRKPPALAPRRMPFSFWIIIADWVKGFTSCIWDNTYWYAAMIFHWYRPLLFSTFTINKEPTTAWRARTAYYAQYYCLYFKSSPASMIIAHVKYVRVWWRMSNSCFDLVWRYRYGSDAGRYATPILCLLYQRELIFYSRIFSASMFIFYFFHATSS